jgi:hypothetical protein
MHYVMCRSHQMQKQKFNVTCQSTIFVESVPVPSEHEKYCVDVSHLGCTGMHYVTRRSHRMQKNKFRITCLEAHFVKSVPVPPELEKWCVDDSLSGRTEMHYVTHISHRMQKQKFDITCPNTGCILKCFLSKLYRSHRSMKNSESTFHALDAPKCTT